jgi:hypothetical protein
VTRGAAAGGTRTDPDEQAGGEQDHNFAAEREVRVEPRVTAARVGGAGKQREHEPAEDDSDHEERAPAAEAAALARALDEVGHTAEHAEALVGEAEQADDHEAERRAGDPPGKGRVECASHRRVSPSFV